jgi:hypothetical protein
MGLFNMTACFVEARKLRKQGKEDASKIQVAGVPYYPISEAISITSVHIPYSN